MRILIILFLLISCDKTPKQFSSILGEWILTTSQINYPIIQFNSDSTAIFSSRGDTIYRYKYYVQDDFLYLIDNEKNKNQFKIEKLDSLNLVFSNLLDNNEKQIYVKNK